MNFEKEQEYSSETNSLNLLNDFDQVYLAQHGLKEQQKPKITLDSFHLLSVIGKGSYAKVALVRKKENGKIYAMKIIKKQLISQKNQQHRIKEERKVLEEVNNQFIVKLKFAFQNEKKLFFVLEYCPGGELFNILSQKNCFTEDVTRFYAAQMVLALEYLHGKNIVYRDLKPENVLIDKQGYIKITDFGLSRAGIINNNEAKSLCGTPEYLAPEILYKQGHGKPVDWWTLGSIIFEMITGWPPYHLQNPNRREELFEKIKTENPKYPSKVQGDLKDLLQKLLEKKPQKRLGYKGAAEVKAHPWFAKCDWEKLNKKEIRAPFIPKLTSETELRYFDPEFVELPLYSPENDKGINNMQDSYQNYSKFTYLPDTSLYSPSRASPIYSPESQRNQDKDNSKTNTNIINYEQLDTEFNSLEDLNEYADDKKVPLQ